MPDPRLSLRALITAHPVRRVLTHVVVIALVAFSSAVGIVAARPGGESAGSGISINLVASARGAAGTPAGSRSATFDLNPDPTVSDPAPLHRDFQVALAPTPLPTPVAPPARAPDPQPMAATVVKPKPVVGTGQLRWPVPGGTITQYFHAGHLAVDIAAPRGSRVIAADAGTVTFAGWRNNGGGLVVQINHGNGISTVYNHLGTILVGPGQVVASGERIANVGCTGLCTGPHVHFEVIVGGVIVNPLRYL